MKQTLLTSSLLAVGVAVLTLTTLIPGGTRPIFAAPLANITGTPIEPPTPVPTSTAVPPTSTAVPPTSTAVPPASTAVPPASTAVPEPPPDSSDNSDPLPAPTETTIPPITDFTATPTATLISQGSAPSGPEKTPLPTPRPKRRTLPVATRPARLPATGAPSDGMFDPRLSLFSVGLGMIVLSLFLRRRNQK